MSSIKEKFVLNNRKRWCQIFVSKSFGLDVLICQKCLKPTTFVPDKYFPAKCPVCRTQFLKEV